MLESKRYPGYFYIPGYSLYVVSNTGDIIQENSGHKISYRRNTSGYYVCSLVNDCQCRRQVSRSRVLCTTFKYRDDHKFLQIDHVNCNKGDDRLENLEWVTGKENCRRASKNGLYKGAHPVRVRDYASGIVTTYPSIAAAGRDLGLNKDMMLYRLESGDGRVYPEGKQYKFAEDLTNWEDREDAQFDIDTFGVCKKALVRNLETGEVTEFEKLSDLAKVLKVSLAALSTRLSNEKHPIFRGLNQVKLKSDKSEWRVPENAILELCGNIADFPIVVVNASTGEKTLYIRQIDCASEHNLRVSTLNYRVKHGNKSHVYPDGYIYRYYSPKLDGSTTSAFARRVL